MTNSDNTDEPSFLIESSISHVKLRPSQTNLQLYRQLLDQKWSEDALALIVKAYEFSLGLFAFQVRPNRKPFVSHLVGAASVAATYCDDADVVAACLLHAAYEFGQWGDRRRGSAPARRDVVARTVGAKAESLVERYTNTAWNNRSVENFLASADRLQEPLRTVIFMRLANEADEWTDLGLRFSVKPGVQREERQRVETIQSLARSLSYPDIADFIELAFEEHHSVSIPSCLFSDEVGSEDVVAQASVMRFALRVQSELDNENAVRRFPVKALRHIKWRLAQN